MGVCLWRDGGHVVRACGVSVKDMPCVTVEQVLALRQKAVELEAENEKLKANQIPENHFVMHQDDLYTLYKWASDHNFKGISVEGCMDIAIQCIDKITENLDNVAERLGHPKFEDWKKVAANDKQY